MTYRVVKTRRACEACGSDQTMKKVWQQRGKKVIGYCCANTHFIDVDGVAKIKKVELERREKEAKP